MSREELSHIVLIYEPIVAHINQLECLVRTELIFLLCEDSQLLSLYFILQMGGPRLEEQFGRLGVENLLLGHQGLRVHRHWSLFSE